MRQQLPNPAVGLRWQPFEHVLQVREGFVAVQARGLNQAHDRSRAFARAQASGEQPVLAPERNGPDLVLDPVVADGHAAVVDVVRERSPALEAVVDGAGDARAVGHLGAHPLPSQEKSLVDRFERSGFRGSSSLRTFSTAC